MPAPPPPPPPPVKTSSPSGGRNALLKDIQQGKRLKKTDTNDRSAPLVEVNKNGVGSSGSGRVRSLSAAGGGGGKVNPPPGLGGLFSGGVPKLKSRNDAGNALGIPPPLPGGRPRATSSGTPANRSSAVPSVPSISSALQNRNNNTLPRSIGKHVTANSASPPALPNRTTHITPGRIVPEISTSANPKPILPSRNSKISNTPPSLPDRSNPPSPPPRGAKPLLLNNKKAPPPPPPIRSTAPNVFGNSINSKANTPPPPPPSRTSIAIQRSQSPPPPPPPPPLPRTSIATQRSQSPPPTQHRQVLPVIGDKQRPLTAVLPTNGTNNNFALRKSINAQKFSVIQSTAFIQTEPQTTEGRWTFHPSSDFPIPPPFRNSEKIYPSGSSTGSSIPLDLSSLSLRGNPQRAPPPPPFGKINGRR
ncbi:hypothetical protein G9A89_016273 [Geosiphon pyriformis]|nr:hypothetical protein G9A89_016273 [Geosiphon pyriformis]